ncbi:ArnT family glycosyltransferase, partial [Aphanothece sacrum]
YLTLLPVVRHGRLAMIDGIINTFFIVAIFCLLKSRKQPNWAIGIGISLGLIALSKGILAIALGGIIVIYCFFDNPKYISKNSALWIGLILGFLPVFTWYILQINHYGELFIEVHFKQQNFDRLSTSVEGNKGSIFYYFIELIKYSFPWFIFLPTALKWAWEKRQENWAKLSIIGLGLFMGIISIMATKLPWYIMPIYPLFSLVIAVYLAKLYEKKKSYPQFLAFLLFMGSGIVLMAGIYLGIEENKISLLIITFSLTITLFSAAWKLKNKSPNFVAILGIGLYINLGSLMMSSEWIWELNESFSVKPVATLIRENTPPGTIIYTSFPYSRTSLDFYSDRQVLADNKDNLQKLASQTSYLLLDKNAQDNLRLSHGKILGEAEGFILLKTFPESKSSRNKQ